MRLTFLLGFAILLVAIDVKNAEAKMTLQQIQNAMKPFNKSCMPKSGVSKEILDATQNGEFPPDRNLQCHQACLLGKMKVLTKENTLSIESMNKQMDIMVEDNILGEMKAMAQKCYDQATSEDPCEMSWEFVKCYYETNPSLYFFP